MARDLFGRVRRNSNPLSLDQLRSMVQAANPGFAVRGPAPNPADPMAENKGRRGGLGGVFGGAFSRENWPRSLNVIGAGLRQINGDEPALDNLLADEQRRALEQQAMGEHKQDRAWAAEDRARELASQQRALERQQQIDAIIEQLPAGEREMARLDPEGYVRQMMRHRFPTPQRATGRGGVDSTPPLPDGFELD